VAAGDWEGESERGSEKASDSGWVLGWGRRMAELGWMELCGSPQPTHCMQPASSSVNTRVGEGLTASMAKSTLRWVTLGAALVLSAVYCCDCKPSQSI
jgi:hypothetical protein